jgi:peptide/nickel transport system substrate-binding protein
MNRVKNWLLAGTLLAAGLSLPAQAATRGGTLVFARAIDSIDLDPVATDQNADIWISLNLFDTLIQPTLDGKGLQPGLATSWGVSDDGKTVTLKLRPGTKFADGSPITADDVKWSLDRARDKDTGGEFAFLLSSIASIDVAAPDTVVLHLAHVDPAIIQALATFNAGIVSKEIFNAMPGATAADKAKAFGLKPVGSGPFVMTSWKVGTEMVLQRNPYYWKPGSDGKPLPYLDKIDCVIIPDDSTRILKLKAGEVDLTEFIPFSRVAELKADPKLNMVLFPSEKVIYLNLNNRPTFKDGSKNPMADVKVRQALNYATDKDALIQVLTYGVGVPQQSFMPMSTPLAWSPGGAPYPYDVDKAKKLLSDAGYAGGFSVSALALAGNADDVAELTALQQMWGDIGVKLKIEQLESTTRLARWKAGDYQTRTSLWTNDINDPNEITSYLAYSSTSDAGHSGYKDPKLDALFDDSQKEGDPAKRAAMYKEIQQLYDADAPIDFLLEVPYPVAMTKSVHGFVQIPLGNNIFVETSVEK